MPASHSTIGPVPSRAATTTHLPAPTMSDLVGAKPSAVAVRPVAPGDLPGLEALFGGLTKEASYRRWFTHAVDIRRAAIWAAYPEAEDALGLVATANGEIVGHGALIPIDDERAEVCFEVAAAWRQQGLASRLLADLARGAGKRGLQTLVAEVLCENADMLAVLRGHGPCREHREGGVVELELPVSLEDSTSVDPR